ncbi:MAG: DUF1343 domain-containing protein [Chlamydiota bacterium]
MRYLFIFFLLALNGFANVDPGVDVFFQGSYIQYIKGKRVGLVTNHTARDKNLITTIERFKKQKEGKLVALFAPEHGIDGKVHAGDHFERLFDEDHIPVFSLYGKTRRPTKEMLQNIDVLVFDIQDIGSRPYTYSTTLFYVMEEAAKYKIPVIVLDRPNPLGGKIVDGPMLETKWRSFLGYINVPYCHGMTIGELALFFNQEYHVGCTLHVIPMKGWKRSMHFRDTHLSWIPSSPNVPEADTPFFYPTTGISGELQIFNIGIGYTLPFKIMGAPWIDADEFAGKLNKLLLDGVTFLPFHYRPYYGPYKNQDCHGVLLVIHNPAIYRPVTIQFALLGILKSLYPKEFLKKFSEVEPSHKKTFCQAIGSDLIFSILQKDKFPFVRLVNFQKKEREEFLKIRQKYLLPEYGS